MKISLLAASAACLLASPARAELPPLPVDSALVRGIDHREDATFEIVEGPFTLAPGQHLRLPVQLAQVPIEGWLHGFSWKVTDARGAPLPDEMLHHVNLIDPDRRDLFMPIARRVMAAGRETRPQAMPKLLGYPLHADTRFLVSTMLSNPTGREVKDGFLHVKLQYSRRGEGLFTPREIFPFYLDVVGPVGPRDFDVPPGRTSRSWDGSPAVDAVILGVGGHLHDFGVELRLEDLTEGKVIWRTEPATEGKTHVVSVPTSELWWKGGVRVSREHRYRWSAIYENPTREPAPDGGMGVVAGVVFASEADWPPLDRKDASYLADLMGTIEAPKKQGAHHHGHAMGH
jgi:hypothetical protein